MTVISIVIYKSGSTVKLVMIHAIIILLLCDLRTMYLIASALSALHYLMARHTTFRDHQFHNTWDRRCSTSWWRHQMEPFSGLLALCAGNSPVTGEFPAQRPVTRSFNAFLDLRITKRLGKQSWGWWFGTPFCSLWRQCNVTQSANG